MDDETDEEKKRNLEHGGKAIDKSNVSVFMSTSTKVAPSARSLAKPVGSVPHFASRIMVPSVVDSFMGPDSAKLLRYCTRPSDDVRVNPVLPPLLLFAAYSVAVPRTVVPVTAPSPVVLTTALPVLRSAVSMRVPALTVSSLSPSGPVPAPVIQPVPLASAPSAQHLTVIDADDPWDWGLSKANAGKASNTDRADGNGGSDSGQANALLAEGLNRLGRSRWKSSRS